MSLDESLRSAVERNRAAAERSPIPPIGRIPRRRRVSPGFTISTLFLLVTVAFFSIGRPWPVSELGSPSVDVLLPEQPATAIPSPALVTAPTLPVAIDDVVVPLFDGSAVALQVPRSWKFDEADVAMSWWMEFDGEFGTVGRDFSIQAGPISRWFGAEELSAEFTFDGQTAYVYEKTGFPAGRYLVFEADSWLLWTWTSNVSATGHMGPVEQEAWAEGVRFQAAADGSPLLSVEAPMRLPSHAAWPPLSVTIGSPMASLIVRPNGCTAGEQFEQIDAGKTMVVRCSAESSVYLELTLHQEGLGPADELLDALSVSVVVP